MTARQALFESTKLSDIDAVSGQWQGPPALTRREDVHAWLSALSTKAEMGLAG